MTQPQNTTGIDSHYTLDDKLYRAGLAAGALTESAFDDDRKIMVVGGAATQLITQDCSGLWRPTTDVDLIFNRHSSTSNRRQWARYLEGVLAEQGYDVTGSLTHAGSEVRFNGSTPDLVVHLDCNGRSKFERKEKFLAEEYERAKFASVEGSLVRHQHPIDVMANKLNRAMYLRNHQRVEVDPVAQAVIDALREGDFDSVDTGDFAQRRSYLMKQRIQNVEDLGRYGYQAILKKVDQYKVEKDMYDCALIVDHSRRNGVTFEGKDFVKHTLDLFSV